MAIVEYQIDFQPIGRRVMVPAGLTLLDAARLAGIELLAICGGMGTCGTCRLRVVKGVVSQQTLVEEAELSAAEIANGMRLGCQAEVLSPVLVEIPPESLATPQRLQVEGKAAAIELDPVVRYYEVALAPPGLTDLRSDITRVKDALKEHGAGAVNIPLAVMEELPERLRRQGWRAGLALRGGVIVGGVAQGARLYGLAVDVGTTKVAAYLVDLQSGAVATKSGAMNPQIAYGEDVIARIAYSSSHPQDGRQVLQERLVATINEMLAGLRQEAGVEQAQVVETVVVGNTAMHHLFAGLPVRQLGESPYVPAVSEALEFPAREVGLEMAAGAFVYMPPNIAGYVGADHVAMLLGAGLPEAIAQHPEQTVLAVDIGTNTEISLSHAGELYSCSCASGPAFEGAHIQDGMRAAAGAIERVRLAGDDVQVHTIAGQPPVGICGSGVLDAVAELRRAGLVDVRGVMKGAHPRLRQGARLPEFVLVRAAESGHGRDVIITRRDVNEIQLAKGAIRAGVEVLLGEAGIPAERIDRFLVAGAFGTYLDLSSALQVGMFPCLPLERFSQIGNAAGVGAVQLLVSRRRREMADQLARQAHYIELTVHPNFTDIYMQALRFE